MVEDRQKWQSAYLSLAASRREDRDSGIASVMSSSPSSSRLSSHDPEDRDSGFRELVPNTEEPLVGDMFCQVHAQLEFDEMPYYPVLLAVIRGPHRDREPKTAIRNCTKREEGFGKRICTA